MIRRTLSMITVRIAGVILSTAAFAATAACTSGNDVAEPAPTSAAAPSTIFATPAFPTPVTRTAPAAPGDRLITQADLFWKTYGAAVTTLDSGAWQPTTLPVKAMVGPDSAARHVADSGDQLNAWIVTGVCFTSDYRVGLEITPREDIPGFDPAAPPAEGNTDSAGPGGRCTNGFLNLNLTADPRR
ncbi:hypothetical protein ACFXHA_44390 [Nocardia sp. NPDC059240]|uniref:hypothetical protein n=1 Tax=Nocardia sp. NPDC059240 TaxID=3346786 RepID=UPI0036C7F987